MRTPHFRVYIKIDVALDALPKVDLEHKVIVLPQEGEAFDRPWLCLTWKSAYATPGPELVADAVARVLERPHRALVVPSSWRLMLLCVRLFPAIADRILGSEQGQARIHTNG